MGFVGSEYEPSVGGAQTPLHIASLIRLPFLAANIGLSSSFVSHTNAVIRLLYYYPNIQNKESLIADMIIGKSHGAVCLTERHSNSSVTDVR